MNKKQGVLFYNSTVGRIGVTFTDGDVIEGLHCGMCFDVLIRREWVPTRIEYNDRWYLVGMDRPINDNLEGLTVRM